MPGCEDPMNKTDTKTKGRGNRGKEGKGSACHTVVLLANRAAQPAPPCATNHLHPHFRPSGHAAHSVWNTLFCPQSGATLPSGSNISLMLEIYQGAPCSASLQWLSHVALSSSLVWSSPMPRLWLCTTRPNDLWPIFPIPANEGSTRLNHCLLSRHSCSGP